MSRNSYKNGSNPGIKARLVSWQSNNPIKSAVAAFAVVVVLGSSTTVYRHFFDNPLELPAVSVQQGEYGVIPAWWLDEHFGSSTCSVDSCKYETDADNDGLTNGQEYFYNADPIDPDTNKNGLTDGEDVANNYDPHRPGKVTFEEALSDETILGESLAFDEDVEEMLAEELDINSVAIELVSDTSLNITTEATDAVYKQYEKELSGLVAKYFPKESLEYIMVTIQSGNSEDLARTAKSAIDLSFKMQEIEVPQELVQFHKYNIAFYRTIAELMVTDGFSQDMENIQGDVWYDKAQSLLAIIQRINFERQRISAL